MFPSLLLSLVTPRDTIFLPFCRDYCSVSKPVPFSDVAVVVNEQPVAVLPMRGWFGDLNGYGFYDSSTAYMKCFLCAAPKDCAVYPFLNYRTAVVLVGD